MARQTLFCPQGADFNTNMDLLADDGTVINVAGYLFGGAIRKHAYSANVSANLVITVTDQANGVATISLSAANTSNLEIGSYLYTIQMKDTSNTTSRLLEGAFIVTPSMLVTEPVPL